MMRKSGTLLITFLILLGPPVALALKDTALWVLSDAEPASAVLFPWVVQAIGVCCFFLLTRFELPLPYAAVMFVIGICMGLGAVASARRAETTDDLDRLSISILQWSNINSAVLLLVFLPGLIFRDAIEVNFNMFMASLPQILILAFPMVLVGNLLTALVGYYVIPYNWPLSLAATLGAILASTDPVAVGSVLKKAGAPPRLQLLISGESLLNDGSAVVFYTIFSQQYLSSLGYADPINIEGGVATFFRMSCGGIAVGVAFAAGLLLILYELDRRLEPEYNVLQVVAALTCAYLSYYVSEQVCAMSGVIACVVCGLVARALGRGLINDNQLMDSYLALMEYLLNTLLFTLGGVVWSKVISDGVTKVISGMDWVYLLSLYLLVMLIRFIQVALFYPIFSRIGLKLNWKEAVFLGYGGLRGAVGIALALSLNRSLREVTEETEKLEATEELEFLAGGVTLLTLLINASTAGPVLKCLGLAKPVLPRKRALRLFNSSAEAFVYKEYQAILLEKRFMRTNFCVVKAHVPFVTTEPTVTVGDENELSERVAAAGLASAEDDYTDSIQMLNVTEQSCPEEILIEMRQIFMELLNEAYTQELANGELDEREDAGINADLLRQSVEFGRADVEHKQRINDWEWLDKQNNFRFFEDLKSYFIRKYRQKIYGQGMDHCCTYDYQQTRITILRAIAFIEAHRLARQKLIAYVDSFAASSMDGSADIFLGNAVDIVLKESAKQVTSAHEILELTPPHEVESIVSHLIAAILLHRLARFVEKSANDGLLTKKEAKVCLERIDRNLQASHTCNKEYASDLRECSTNLALGSVAGQSENSAADEDSGTDTTNV